eukprot:COSAG01_NODE_16418_length_1237_cov_2.394552_1_plen_158_part_00
MLASERVPHRIDLGPYQAESCCYCSPPGLRATDKEFEGLGLAVFAAENSASSEVQQQFWQKSTVPRYSFLIGRLTGNPGPVGNLLEHACPVRDRPCRKHSPQSAVHTPSVDQSNPCKLQGFVRSPAKCVFRLQTIRRLRQRSRSRLAAGLHGSPCER